MFAVIVSGNDEPTRRRAFAAREITFGRDPASDVVLPGEHVSPKHARLVQREGKYVLVDLQSERGTFVNDRKLTSPLVIRMLDHIAMGPYAIRIEEILDLPLAELPRDATPLDPIEAELLEAVGDNVEGSRLVYADWLEERDQLARVEFLRLQEQLVTMAAGDPAFELCASRLRELAQHVDIHWRVRVARPAVARCAVAFDFKCPMEWGRLAPTDRESVRFCGACNQQVHYCASVAEARAHAAKGACVALDIASARWPDDLAAPYDEHLCPRCELDVGPAVSNCPRCDTPLRQMMVLGRMPARRDR